MGERGFDVIIFSTLDLPLVSVIVPARNEACLIGDCLQSLLNQNYPQDRLEIIAVDNDSTDDSRAVIHQFPVRYLFERKRGAASARNAGARRARGDFLAFTDSDCIVPRHWVSRLVSALKKDPADAGGGDCLIVSRGSLIEDYLAYRGFYSQKEFFSSESPSPPWLMTGNLMVHRKTFEKLGGFEEGLLRGEDVDFSWRIALAGGRLRYLADLKVALRRSPSPLDFYAKNFKDGKAASFLNGRYHSLNPPPFGRSLFQKLIRQIHGIFFAENKLLLRQKLSYFLLACTGHLAFQAGKLIRNQN